MTKTLYLIFTIAFICCQTNPNNLQIETNFVKGLKMSEASNKPIFLNFTGYGCMGYDEFMNDLITSKEIHNTLNNEFVTIQLYVDDRTEIQESDIDELSKIEFLNKVKSPMKIRTIGNMNAKIEIDLVHKNNQPLYVVIDSKGNVLIEPFGYSKMNKSYFLAKLKEGLNKFKK